MNSGNMDALRMGKKWAAQSFDAKTNLLRGAVGQIYTEFKAARCRIRHLEEDDAELAGRVEKLEHGHEVDGDEDGSWYEHCFWREKVSGHEVAVEDSKEPPDPFAVDAWFLDSDGYVRQVESCDEQYVHAKKDCDRPHARRSFSRKDCISLLNAFGQPATPENCALKAEDELSMCVDGKAEYVVLSAFTKDGESCVVTARIGNEIWADAWVVHRRDKFRLTRRPPEGGRR